MNREDKIGLLAYIGILVLTLISIASAETIYSGECRSIEFPNIEPVNWSVEGNLSDMEGFSFNKTGTNITYCFHQLYKPDNFTITFYNYQLVEVVEQHYNGGGGSSCTYNKTFNWNCSTWSECIDSKQTRTCKKYNNCYNTYGKPNETQNCIIIEANKTEITPTLLERVIQMREQGDTESQIIEILTSEGIPLEEINNALAQSKGPESWFSKYKGWIIIGIILIVSFLTFIIYKIIRRKVKIKNDINIQNTTKTPELSQGEGLI